MQLEEVLRYVNSKYPNLPKGVRFAIYYLPGSGDFVLSFEDWNTKREALIAIPNKLSDLDMPIEACVRAHLDIYESALMDFLNGVDMHPMNCPRIYLDVYDTVIREHKLKTD